MPALNATDPRPTPPDRVRLRVGTYETLAPVIAVEDDMIELRLPAPVPGPAEIVFSHPRGVISLTGTIEAIGGEGATFSIAETNKLEQRRGAFRLAVACPVHILRGGGSRLDYRTADLSITGVRILDAYELLDGEPLGLEIQLETRGMVEVRGRVVRRDELSVGVAFTEMPFAAENALGAFINDAQRARLRAAA